MRVVDLDDYMTPMDAAVELKINYATLMARIDRGKIPTVRVGRFHLIHRDVVKKAGEHKHVDHNPGVGGTAR